MIEMLTDEELITKYVEHMTWRELQPTTINVRESYLRKFAREMKGLGGLEKEQVQDWLSRDSLQPQSRNVWLTCLRVFYAFCNERGYFPKVLDERGDPIAYDPTRGILKPKTHKGKPHPITNADLKSALEHADLEMACWLLLGSLAGCRCLEIATVRREDVHEADLEPWLDIPKGKGNKQRAVPLHPDLSEALQALPMPSSGNLWNMTAQEMSKAVNKYLHDLGAKTVNGDPATAHSLRHWYGTAMYRQSKDLQLVADLLGHSNTVVTSVYAAADHRTASSVVNKLKI